MATEAEATREARAKVVASQGEKNASIALKEAADTISLSPVALQLRYLQTLTHIAAEKNSTIVFPIPIELFRAIQIGGKPKTSLWDALNPLNQLRFFQPSSNCFWLNIFNLNVECVWKFCLDEKKKNSLLVTMLFYFLFFAKIGKNF